MPKNLFRYVASLAVFALVGIGLTPPAIASTGVLTVVSSGGAAEGSGWTYSAGQISVTGTVSINSSDIENKLGLSNLEIIASQITVSSDIVSVSLNKSLTLKATDSISIIQGVEINLNGGEIKLWSDSDGTSGGYVLLGNKGTSVTDVVLIGTSQCDLNSNGGNITIGGGVNFATGFASGGTSVPITGKPIFGIGIFGCSLNAGGGNISLRGNSGTSSNSVRAILIENNLASIKPSFTTSGTGWVNIFGESSFSTNSTTNWGPTGGFDVTTSAGDITISGKSDNAIGNNRRGLAIGNFNLTSSTGDILIEDQTPGANVSFAGSFLSGSNSISTAGSIVIATNKFNGPWFSDLTLSTGPVSIVPYSGNSFDMDFSLGPVTATNAASLTIGVSGNTRQVTIGTIGSALNVGGPLTVHGGNISLSGTSSATTANIYSSGTVSQSASASFTALGLHGSGTFNLTNTSNNFGTIAAGTNASKLTSLNLVDASGGLTIGQVGSLEGIYATGDTTVETLDGDIQLTKNILTDSTSSTAITLNAGKSTAIGTDTGGDIIVSGSPTITKGANAVARFFSGSEAASTGLTTLVGGSNFVQYGVDETTTFSPALTAGTNNALYRSTVQSPPTSGGGSSGGSSGSTNTTVTNEVTVTPVKKPKKPKRVAPVIKQQISTPLARSPIEILNSGFNPDGRTRAVVNGQESSVTKRVQDSRALAIRTARLNLAVDLNENSKGEIKELDDSGQVEIIVPRTENLKLSGGGSFAGSSVQVWLAGKEEGGREIGRIPVATDGTFETELRLASSRAQLPIPIGKQILQVVGYDAEGRQTIIDMTINIAQGAPAPEENRFEGKLPELKTGENLTTSGGLPIDGNITFNTNARNIDFQGEDWSFGIKTENRESVVEESSVGPFFRLQQTSTATASGTGFQPDTIATVWLFSNPTLLASVPVDENGNFSASFLVDAQFIAEGEHTLQVQGVGVDGLIKAANLGVVVEKPLEPLNENDFPWVAVTLGSLGLLLVIWLLFAFRRKEKEEELIEV